VRFDKSLKILNYAKNNAGYVELYTELDHSFVAGDKVFIVGGYYDNTNTLLYTSQFSALTPALYNPYAIHRNGYTVRSVNYTQNSFTIGVPATMPMYYPFGVSGNPLGDPQDGANLAYNDLITPNLYNNVYVSRAAFITGRFRKGTINNGIFGNDKHKVRLNMHENFATNAVKSDVSITHIAVKNASVSKCVISSKTDSLNPLTIKLKVVEDATFGPVASPYYVTNVAVGPNNDTWGYSAFQAFTIYQESTIYNGDFSHPASNAKGIEIKYCTILHAKVGANEPLGVQGCMLTESTLLSGYLGNFTPNYLTAVTFGSPGMTSNIDTYIELNPTSVSWGALPGEVILNVAYDTVAHRDWHNSLIATAAFVSGITPILPAGNPQAFNDNSMRYDITNAMAFVNATPSYTTGDVNSAQIILTMLDLVANWVLFTSTYTPANFDFSKTKLSFQTLDNMRITGNTTIRSCVYSNQVYLDGVGCVVKEGTYVGLAYSANTRFLGSSTGESILLVQCKQMFQTATTVLPIFTYTTIQYGAPIKGDFNNCKIYAGTIQNSTITNTFIAEYTVPVAVTLGYADTPIIYLYNDTCYGETRIAPGVHWDLLQFNGTLDEAVNNYPINAYIKERSFLGARKTRWKTGPYTLAPLGPTTLSPDLNKLEGLPALFIYNSQTVTQPNASILPAELQRSLFYHVPSLEHVQPVFDDTKFMSIVDHGGMLYTSPFFGWLRDPTKNRNDILFSDYLDTPASTSIRQKILNRTTYDVSGTTVHFTGVDPLTASISDIRRVDDKFEHEYPAYYNDDRAREQSDISINVYELPPVQVGQPDPAYIFNSTQFLKFQLIGPPYTIIDGIMPGTTTVPNGQYSLSFRHYGPLENQCFVIPFVGTICVPTPTANVPACFIEVERVIVKSYDAVNDLKDVQIHNCNYCPQVSGIPSGSEYSWNYLAAGVNYPTDFQILNPFNNTVEFVKITSNLVTDHVKIEVEYWVTWYFAQTSASTADNLPFGGFTGGYREKKIDVYDIN